MNQSITGQLIELKARFDEDASRATFMSVVAMMALTALEKDTRQTIIDLSFNIVKGEEDARHSTPGQVCGA